MKRMHLTRMATLLLTMVLVISLVPVSAMANSIIGGRGQNNYTNSENKDWESNVLSASGLDAFKKNRSRILSVTFMDSLYSAPNTVWYLGKGSNKNVQGWVEYAGKNIHVYIAAEGGMSAELCAEGFFKDCDNLEAIYFNGAFHTEKVESMKDMFKGCAKLKYVDIETLDTSKVKNMKQMFRDCKALKELDVSEFDTSKVTDMSYMFSTCTALEELDLSSFNTAKVTNMSYMFSGCKNLEYVNTSSFNTSKVTNMSYMFRWCTNLARLDLGGWDFSRVTKYNHFMNPDIYVDGRPWKKLFD